MSFAAVENPRTGEYGVPPSGCPAARWLPGAL
jgi:hypothetical protein